MKKKLLLSSFIVTLTITLCSAQTPNDSVTKPTPADSVTKPTPKKYSPSEIEAAFKAGIDPYFVETQDTFSLYGPKCIVRNVIEDKKGNIWLATWSGIIKYDGKIFTNYTLKNKLIHFHVLSLFEDSKGNLWFGTVRGGVYCYNGSLFKLFTKKSGLPDSTALCFAEDKEGNIWIGTENGASRYDGETFTNYTTKEGLRDNYVNAIICDKAGKLWFGTNNGINCYNGKTFTKFLDKTAHHFQQVTSLLEGKDGKIWIGVGKGKGLCYFDGAVISDYLISNFVMYMCQDKKGNLWLAHNNWPATKNFILYCYDGKTFAEIIEQKSPLNNPAIFGIMEDKAGNIWFGTVEGVCRYDGKTCSYFTE